MVSGGEGRSAPVAANVDVVVGENHRLASGAADALQDEARRIGAGAVAHWHILGHWLTWSNPAHLPAGRPHLSYSAWVGLGLGLGLGLGEGGGDNFDEGGGVAREAAVMAPEAMAREGGAAMGHLAAAAAARGIRQFVLLCRQT